MEEIITLKDLAETLGSPSKFKDSVEQYINQNWEETDFEEIKKAIGPKLGELTQLKKLNLCYDINKIHLFTPVLNETTETLLNNLIDLANYIYPELNQFANYLLELNKTEYSEYFLNDLEKLLEKNRFLCTILPIEKPNIYKDTCFLESIELNYNLSLINLLTDGKIIHKSQTFLDLYQNHKQKFLEDISQIGEDFLIKLLKLKLLNEQSANNYYDLAKVFFNQEKYEDALNFYKIAFELNPDLKSLTSHINKSKLIPVRKTRPEKTKEKIIEELRNENFKKEIAQIYEKIKSKTKQILGYTERYKLNFLFEKLNKNVKDFFYANMPMECRLLPFDRKGDYIILSKNNACIVYNSKTGKKIYEIKNPVADYCINDDQLFLLDEVNRYISNIDLKKLYSGNPIWKNENPMKSFAELEDKLVGLSAYGHIYTFDKATGKQIWKSEERYKLFDIKKDDVSGLSKIIALDCNDEGKYFDVIEPETGQVLWRKDGYREKRSLSLEYQDCDKFNMRCYNNRLYVLPKYEKLDRTNTLKVFDIKTGNLCWKARGFYDFKISDNLLIGLAEVSPISIYSIISTINPILCAANLETGRGIWENEFRNKINYFEIFSNTVYAISENNYEDAFDIKTGEKLEGYRPREKFMHIIKNDESNIYFLSDGINRKIISANLKTGQKNWQVSIDENISSCGMNAEKGITVGTKYSQRVFDFKTGKELVNYKTY